MPTSGSVRSGSDVLSVDTSVAVDHLRGAPPAVQLLDGLIAAGQRLLASEVVRFELLAGVRDRERALTERFFAAIDWVPVTEGIARRAGELARQFRRSHGGIDVADYMVAATALELDAPLLTRNVRHFPMLEALEPAYE